MRLEERGEWRLDRLEVGPGGGEASGRAAMSAAAVTAANAAVPLIRSGVSARAASTAPVGSSSARSWALPGYANPVAE